MSTSASFPRVGDRFTTIDDWKIAVYQACLRHGMRLGAVQSMPQVFCHLRCPNVPPTSEYCTFTTSIKRPPYSAPGAALVVDTLIDQHTCAAQVRLGKKPTAKTFVEKRLAKLMPTVGGSGGRPATSNRSEPSSTTPTSIGRKRKMSLKAVEGDPSGGRGRKRKRVETPLDASLTNRDNPFFTPSTPGHHFPSTSKSATTPSLHPIAVVASTCRTDSTAARPTTPALMPPLRPPALVPSASFPCPSSILPRSATSYPAVQPPAAPPTTSKPSSSITGDLILSIPSTTPLSPSLPSFLTSLSPSLPSSSHSFLLTSLPLCGLKTLEDLFLLCSLEERGLKVLVETLGMRKEMGEGEARRLFEALRGVREVVGRVEQSDD
ncbi:hypothetical protein JCM11641_000682 [Rhodosporidiobolus odoratus]